MVELDQEILTALLEDNCTEEEYTTESDAIETYSDDWYSIKHHIEKLLHPRQRPSSPASSEFDTAASTSMTVESKKKKQFKLPKIELKKFDGDVTQWLGFWSQFQKINDDEELHACDKFQYLTQSMVAGTRAQEVVNAYPQTSENYPKVVAALQDRFGKPKMLKRVYVRELLNLVIKNSNSKIKVSEIYDKLESHLHSLESLGITPDQMDVILFPLVESCLPMEILTAWQRSQNYGRDGSGEVPPKTEFNFLMEFIKQEVEGEQQRTLAQTAFGVPSKSAEKQKGGQNSKGDKKNEIATAAGLFTGQGSECLFCDKLHPSQECGKAQTMNLRSKEEKIKEKRACFICFRKGHGSKDCKAYVKCILCSKKHFTMMCPNLPANQKQKIQKTCKDPEQSQAVATNLNCTNSVLLKTILVKAFGKKGKRTVRLIFDDGSQKSYIRGSTAKQLNLLSTGEEMMKKSLFGGHTTETTRHQKYEVVLQGLKGGKMEHLNLIDEPTLCGKIPKVPNGPWIEELEKRNVVLSDFSAESLEIEILIGSDYWGTLMTGNVIKLKCGLIAMETSLGWTLSGPIHQDSIAMTVTSALCVENVMVSDLWNLDTIGIRDPIESLTKLDREAIVTQHFEETVKRGTDGRYSVCLPWTDGRKIIPSNRSVAEKRLINATAKLKQAGKFEDYAQIFDLWKQEGFITEDVRNVNDENSHFLPHRAVFKPTSLTTPLRPVFDASCKTGRNPSLNDCLEKGPNLLELIPSILLRFRENNIGVISDIRKAFQMIEVHKADRKYQKFLWWEDEECKRHRVYQHNRVVFGVNCSPFLLQAVLNLHLRQYTEDSEIAMKLLRSLYVDNCVTSVDTRMEYEKFKEKSTRFLAEAKMDLRQWERSGDDLGVGSSIGDECRLSSATSTCVSSVLGLKWDKKEDVLSLDLSIGDPEFKEEDTHPGLPTKRKVLSLVQKVFDPIGFTAPATLQPKIILQGLWTVKLGWDEEIPPEVAARFKKWYEEMKFLREIKIPRQIITTKEADALQIHTFGDASKMAYAAVVFIRSVENGNVSVHLAQAKARVAPLKRSTIPRLELLASLIGARLAKSTLESLDLTEVRTFYWSDSTTALAWIRRNDDWGTFVGNRVKEILVHTKPEDWRHVPGTMNPADLPSRGCSPLELVRSRWWEGPEWLKKPQSEWPLTEYEVDEAEVVKEKKKRSAAMVSTEAQVKGWFNPTSHSFHRNARILGWVRRYLNNLKNTELHREKNPFLSLTEIRDGEKELLKIIQQESFQSEMTEIKGVPVTKYEDGLLRIKTKLFNKKDTDLFRLPILLPNSHPYVNSLIAEMHLIYNHTGTQCLLGELRERFWILQGRKAVRRNIRQCVKCRRHEAKCLETEPTALPEKRVNLTASFQTTGVDLAGPLYLKTGEKAWIVLYTCAVYRCIHLDLISSLSTEAFLYSLERFINSSGRPITVYSDNGTNFVGAVNLFKKLDWDKIRERCQAKQIQWIFNPPTAAWWGGWWERIVRSVKDQLKRMLGRAKLTEDQMRTCLTSVTAAINNRPLTTLTEDPEDLIPLTPSMFLRGPIDSSFPENGDQREGNPKRLQKDCGTQKRTGWKI